jgi:hypothetical protein
MLWRTEEVGSWYMTVSYGAGLVVSYSGQCVGVSVGFGAVGGRASCGAAGG